MNPARELKKIALELEKLSQDTEEEMYAKGWKPTLGGDAHDVYEQVFKTLKEMGYRLHTTDDDYFWAVTKWEGGPPTPLPTMDEYGDWILHQAESWHDAWWEYRDNLPKFGLKLILTDDDDWYKITK